MSLVLTTASHDLKRLALEASGAHLVVGLCAAWCDTCREFETTFAAVAAEHREFAFVWLDVEDDAAIAGDIDIETFPCLAVFRDGRAVHFGATTPQYAVVSRLVSAVLENEQSAVVPDAVAQLPEKLERAARLLNPATP